MTHLAKVKNASSTPSLDFALVSRNLRPNSSASCLPCSSETDRFSSQSHLFPMRILLTPAEACCSMFECHVRTSEEGQHQPHSRVSFRERGERLGRRV